MAMSQDPRGQLKRLSETHLYEVAGDSHDIRGWPVVDAAGAALGRVSDLLFDVESDQVRYAIVETPDSEVLVPVGSLGFEEHARRVVATSFSAERLREQVPFKGAAALSPEAEREHYGDVVPGHPESTPLDYSISPFGGVSTERIDRLQQQLRETRRQDGLLPLAETPELAFAGSEPSDEELAERERLQQDWPLERQDRFPRAEQDFGLDRPR